jgi:adenylate cyclase
MMNDFLTPMSDLVMENRGTIDKYMGDAMMAFWNAPLDVENHAYYACKTALQMNEALEPLNDVIKQKAEEEGVKPILLAAGIGINTGLCSVGNMGSKQRFAYSALGDAVNLASRLEGQTKSYGVTILIGHDTYENGARYMAVMELDRLRVKGKLEPVRVYTLLGDEKVAKSQEFKAWHELHEEMLEFYRMMDWTMAEQLIIKCKEAATTDQLHEYYDMMQRRVSIYRDYPPVEKGQDWDGVYVAQTK